jgi:cytidylate kinase
MKKLTIAIDGWSSCGKSTLAKQLAKKLGYTYIDTGAMYRAITLFFLRHEVDLKNESEIETSLKKIDLEFKLESTLGDQPQMFLNGEHVETQIRSMAVAEWVSQVAAIKAVRSFAVHQQQQMGANGGVVMDGRDIGTFVFPNAEVKFFMTASPTIRAQRRFLEMQQKNTAVSMEQVMENLQYRDHLDSTREESPLTQAPDSVVIDNSNLNMEEQLNIALQIINKIINPNQE